MVELVRAGLASLTEGAVGALISTKR